MNLVRNLVLTVVFGGMIACAAAVAQVAPGQPVPAPAPMYPATSGPYVYGYQATPYYGAADAQLAKDYIKADKEDAKKDIRKKLADSLAKQFDQHLQQQQKELDDLEKQIANLKDVVKKRQAAKNDIVDRRVEQLIRDAEGLGWNAPSNPRVPGSVGFGGFGGFVPAARPVEAPPVPKRP